MRGEEEKRRRFQGLNLRGKIGYGAVREASPALKETA